MSFFGYLAAGAAEGVGKGMVGEADFRDKAAITRELQAEKDAAALRLQRERAQDRADRERENLLLRKELGGMGGGGKGGGFNLFQLATETPPEKQPQVVEAVRAGAGDEAANVVARLFGDKNAGAVQVNPSSADFARYDRSVDENGQGAGAPPQSFTRPMEGSEAEKGRIALNRLMAMTSGKFKDYAEGEARAVGTDAVRGAVASGQDMDLRKAGAVNMALEGRERRGIANGTEYDKAGIGASTTTEVGRSQINENNAQAGKHSADAAKVKEGGGGKGERLSDLIRATDADLLNIRTQLNALKNSFTPDAEAAVKELRQREKGVLEQKGRYVTELESRVLPKKGEPEPAPAQKAPASAPAGPVKITSEAQFKALKSGTTFIAPDGSRRVKP